MRSSLRRPSEISRTWSPWKISARLIVRYSAGEYRRILLGILLMFGMSAVALLQPWPLKLVLDSVLGPKAPSGQPALFHQLTDRPFLPVDRSEEHTSELQSH